MFFWYDAEMNSGGYSGYLDCYPDTNSSELKEAIMLIGYKEIADNNLVNKFTLGWLQDPGPPFGG